MNHIQNKNLNLNPARKYAWLIFLAVLIVAIQFFWVLKTYYIIESQKVIWWMIKYFSIPYLVGPFFVLNKFNKLLFYSYSSRYLEGNLTKWNQFKNKLTSYVLIVLMISFFTYDTIIQTNDWFGSSKQEVFNKEINTMEFIQHTRTRRGFRGGEHETTDIYITYHGKERVLSVSGTWNGGDTLNLPIRTGGFWGILYLRSLN
jgi:hypothetical protein